MVVRARPKVEFDPETFLIRLATRKAAATGSVLTFDTWTLCLHTLLIAEKKQQTNTFGAFLTDLQSLL
jgi:hypothetical protein